MLTRIIVSLIEFYQRRISPLKPKSCRFYPTCSEYTRQAFEKKGIWKGFYYSFCRLMKCHPFHSGGYDPLK